MLPPVHTLDPSAPDAYVALIDELADAARRSSRTPGDVTIVAATKYTDLAIVRRLAEHGITTMGESRWPALRERRDDTAHHAWASSIEWHFIGRLQSREVPRIAERVSMIHSLCSLSAAERLVRVDDAHRPRTLVQVNVDGDAAKDGIAPAELERFLTDLPDQLIVHGLMTMPAAAVRGPDDSRRAFAGLRTLRDQLAGRFAGRHPLTLLSMGTSQDAVVAVEEGATHVRLGRRLTATLEP